jgi:hypothetical protein
MKLGILVVYLVSPEAEWILEKHLEHLAKTKPFMSFRVYAAVHRLEDRYRSMLRRFDFIEVIDHGPLPAESLRGGGEHGTYLDMLAAHAVSDGCDFVCTYDVDSWPICDDWIEVSWNLITQNRAVAAAILRAENGDTVLPHPSFCFIRANLFHHAECRFWVTESDMRDDMRAFGESNNQRIDTGFGLGYFLHEQKLDWVKLLRSNKKDYHYLMAGVYNDLIFHLGAGSRKKRFFARDKEPWSERITRPLCSVPRIWRYRQKLTTLLETVHTPSLYKRHQVIFDTIVSKINSNENAFYRELLGSGLNSSR